MAAAAAAVATAQATIKGTAVLATMKFIRERFGDADHERVLGALPGEHAANLGGAIISSAQLPLDSLIAYIGKADEILGHGDLSLCEEAGRYSAYESLATVFKLFMKISNPLGMVRRAAGMWRHFNSSGELEVVLAEPNHIVLHLKAFARPGGVYCRRLVGYFRRVVEVTGGKEVVVRHPHCAADGATSCEFDVTWRDTR
ncbi:MAG: hypothetical protein AAB426_00220 [Myxococcota bacterium]